VSGMPIPTLFDLLWFFATGLFCTGLYLMFLWPGQKGKK